MSIIAYALNLIDLLCTLWALYYGVMEMNPLMQSVMVMVIYKVIIVGVLLWWLSHQRERLARYALYSYHGLWGSVPVALNRNLDDDELMKEPKRAINLLL